MSSCDHATQTTKSPWGFNTWAGLSEIPSAGPTACGPPSQCFRVKTLAGLQGPCTFIRSRQKAALVHTHDTARTNPKTGKVGQSYGSRPLQGSYSFIRSRRPLYIHTTRCLLLERQGKQAKGMVPCRCKDHTALSDQGGPSTHARHGTYYLKDRESRPKARYLDPVATACKHNVA